MATLWLQVDIGPPLGSGGYAASAGSTDDLSYIYSQAAYVDFGLAMNTATNGYVAAMGGSISYSNSAGTISGTVGTSGGSVTLSQSVGNALTALLSTAGGAVFSACSADAQTGTVIVGYDSALNVNQIVSALRAAIANFGY